MLSASMVFSYACSPDSKENPDQDKKEEPVPDPDPEPDPEPDPDPTPTPLPDTVKVLAIGNSFSCDCIEQELWGLFDAIGQKVIIGDMYIGGSSLAVHTSHVAADDGAYSYRKIGVDGVKTTTASVKLSDSLKDEDWTFISIQDGAGFHGYFDRTYTCEAGTFSHKMEPDLTTLLNYVKAACPNAKIIYNAPWSAQKGYTGVKFSYYNYDQDNMDSMIREATQQVAAAHPEIDIVINVMDAVANARTSYIGDNMNRDGWHLSYTVGRYTASCIWYEKLTGRSVVGNTYHPSTITADVTAEVCQTAAHEAVQHPYQTTDLSYFKEPEEQVSANKTLAKWYFSPERSASDGNIMSWTGQNTLGVYRYSLEPGERGFMTANEAGSGKLSYVQVDKTSFSSSYPESAGLCALSATNGGQPCMCGQMAGDYWLWETTGNYQIAEGSRVSIIYTYTPSKYGAKYWLVEYLDGETWKPAFENKTETLSLSGEKITYNLALTASEFTIVNFEVVLENTTPDFKVRQVCCSETQVNDKYFAYPNVKSVQRVAGDPANPEKPLPEITLVLD